MEISPVAWPDLNSHQSSAVEEPIEQILDRVRYGSMAIGIQPYLRSCINTQDSLGSLGTQPRINSGWNTSSDVSISVSDSR